MQAVLITLYKTYIFVIDTFEKYQLPVGTFSMGLVLEGPTQLFHCYWYTEDCIHRRAGHTLYRGGNTEVKVKKEQAQVLKVVSRVITAGHPEHR